MEDILKTLSDYQIAALRKGISFDIDLSINDKKVPVARVRMSYTVTGPVAKGYAFDTTFSPSICQSKHTARMNEIDYFISTVTGPIENE